MSGQQTDSRRKFLIYALGIFLCYFYYGVIQEKITRGKYGTEVNKDGSVGERFTLSLALVLVQCICNYLFASGMLAVKKQKPDTTHTGYYISCSLTYVLAMVGSNLALRWVPYPTQVVGKAAKPIPVMILGVLIGKKSYSWIRYTCVLTIVIGVILFMYNESKTNSGNTEHTGLGELLLLLSLLMDGLTGAVQERMRSSSSPSGQQMMLNMNFWSMVMLGGALLPSGEGKAFIEFSIRHPKLLIDIGTLAFAGGLGQLFIFLMVSRHGPLACSVVTTTRKFFTVLTSVILFGNVLTSRQWTATVLVFVGLFADMILGKKATPTKLTNAVDKAKNESKEKLLS